MVSPTKTIRKRKLVPKILLRRNCKPYKATMQTTMMYRRARIKVLYGGNQENCLNLDDKVKVSLEFEMIFSRTEIDKKQYYSSLRPAACT